MAKRFSRLLIHSREKKRLRTTIYTKPTETDRLLDQSSYNPFCHRATYDYTDFDETGATTLRLERDLTT